MDQYPEQANGLARRPGGRWQLLPGYTGLYLSSAFRSLGMSLVGLFIPLYVFKITGSLTFVFLFYALYHFFVVLFDYPAAILVKRLGIDLVGFLGALSRAFFIFLLLKAESTPGLIWGAAIAWGLTVVLTWLPFHYAFTIAEREDGKYGKEFSRLQIVNKMVSFLGPVSGGLIITLWGFKPLFSFVIVLTIISGLPLFFDRVKDKGMRLSFKKILGHLIKKERSKFWLSLVGTQLAGDVLGLAWPLFIFLAVKNYQTLGLIKSAATVVSLILVWFLGKWVDRRGKAILRLGTLVNGFNVLLRPFLINPFSLFLIDSVYTMTADLMVMPFNTAFYEQAIKMRKLEFMVEREFVLNFTGMVVCLVLGLMFALEISWFWIFFLAAIGILMKNYILSTEEG